MGLWDSMSEGVSKERCQKYGKGHVDNDPDGLGYMPDSQGPQYGSKPTLTGAGVSGPRISPSDVFSPWHKSRERNYQCPLGALIIPLPHVFPPTYVGFGISYILGNLIKAKINVP